MGTTIVVVLIVVLVLALVAVGVWATQQRKPGPIARRLREPESGAPGATGTPPNGRE